MWEEIYCIWIIIAGCFKLNSSAFEVYVIKDVHASVNCETDEQVI